MRLEIRIRKSLPRGAFFGTFRASEPDPPAPTAVPCETTARTVSPRRASIFTEGPGLPIYSHWIDWVDPCGHSSPPFGETTAMGGTIEKGASLVSVILVLLVLVTRI